MATSHIEGTAELAAKLKELGSPKEQIAALKASVREPMKAVQARAQANIARISPGERLWHKTYKGRIVGRGYASRSIGLKVFTDKAKTMATAMLGVTREAFYAIIFFELGTSKIPKQPWLLPAFYSLKDESVAKLAATLRKRIERIAKKRAAGK